MKKQEFNVPVETMLLFADTLGENDLKGKILGITKDDEIIVEVRYEKEDRQIIHELNDIIEDYFEEDEEEDEDDEEYDDGI